MRSPISICLSIASLSALVTSAAATGPDLAVIAMMRREAPVVRHTVVLERLQATDREDLVLVWGTPRALLGAHQPTFAWTTEDRLGLYLQDRREAGLIYRLTVAAGPNQDCFAAVARFTVRDLVLSCVGEKWTTYKNQKFVFDVRAKALVKQFSYWPFAVARIFPGARGPSFVMSDGQKLLLVDTDPQSGRLRIAPQDLSERILSRIPLEAFRAGDSTFHRPARPPDPAAAFGPARRFGLSQRKNGYGSEYPVVVERRGMKETEYDLSQSTLPEWRAARPDEARTPMAFDPLEMNEQIGPHQIEGNRLWFGKTFYNGEGLTGVGGFGYFDANARKYRLYSPPEIRKWSVSAILVQPECVWLALDHRGEYGNTAGGLLRWDRKTEKVVQFNVNAVITSIAQDGGALYLGAADRILVLRGGSLSGYFVDRTGGGAPVVSTGHRDSSTYSLATGPQAVSNLSRPRKGWLFPSGECGPEKPKRRSAMESGLVSPRFSFEER